MCIDKVDTTKLKEYIIENDLARQVLENCGFEISVDSPKHLSCSNLDGDNKTAVCIFKNTLIVNNYTRNYNGDIFTLIQKTFNKSFPESIKIVSDCLDYSCDIQVEKPNILTTLCNLENLSDCLDESPLEILSENILNNYQKIANDLWIKEGISPSTQESFEIMYDKNTSSIIIPIRDELGNLVGVKNRKNTSQQDIKMKYYYSYPVKKNRTLFNLYKSKPFIKKRKLCIIVESEKSVLKLWQEGIDCALAISGSDISLNQVQMLERLNVPIILAYDKDKDLEHMTNQMNKFLSCVDVSCIIDDDNLLEEKDSPIDKGIEVFKKVYKNKYNRDK